MLTRVAHRTDTLLRDPRARDAMEPDVTDLRPVPRPKTRKFAVGPVERETSARPLVPGVPVRMLRDLRADALILLVMLHGHLLEPRVPRLERVEVRVLLDREDATTAAAA